MYVWNALKWELRTQKNRRALFCSLTGKAQIVMLDHIQLKMGAGMLQ